MLRGANRNRGDHGGARAADKSVSPQAGGIHTRRELHPGRLQRKDHWSHAFISADVESHRRGRSLAAGHLMIPERLGQ